MIQFMMAMVPLLLTLHGEHGQRRDGSRAASLHRLHGSRGRHVDLYVVFPLLFFSAVLHIASSFSDRFKVTQLANLLRTVGAGLLGVMLTVFLGVISVQGATGRSPMA